MKLQQLRALLAVTEAGSFSEAALDLGVAQSSLSYAIAELERELGVKLLQRGRFGAEPTEIGAKIAAHARGIAKLTEVIQQEADLSKGEIKGTLTVATFRSAAGKIVPKAITLLRCDYPELNVRFIERDNEGPDGNMKRQMVRDHLADVAFVESAEDDGLLAWELMRDPYRALLHESDPRTFLAWSDLPRTSFILSDCNTCGNQVQRYARELNLELEPAYSVQGDSTVLRLVSEGLGVGVLPEFAIDELPDNVKVVPLDSLLERVIYVAIAPSSLKVPAVRVFLEVLKTQFPKSGLPRLEVDLDTEAKIAS